MTGCAWLWNDSTEILWNDATFIELNEGTCADVTASTGGGKRGKRNLSFKTRPRISRRKIPQVYTVTILLPCFSNILIPIEEKIKVKGSFYEILDTLTPIKSNIYEFVDTYANINSAIIEVINEVINVKSTILIVENISITLMVESYINRDKADKMITKLAKILRDEYGR